MFNHVHTVLLAVLRFEGMLNLQSRAHCRRRRKKNCQVRVFRKDAVLVNIFVGLRNHMWIFEAGFHSPDEGPPQNGIKIAGVHVVEVEHAIRF